MLLKHYCAGRSKKISLIQIQTELAVRVGPLATCFCDGIEMLDVMYALTSF